jgi:hypothetical protein
VVDFVNARPGAQLRNLSVNRTEVKSVRVGLFSSDPPVTRLVLDLNGPQPYQLFPAGRTVMLKIGGSAGAESAVLRPASMPVLVNTKYPDRGAQVVAQRPAVRPRLEVSFQNGLLSVSSNKANLSEILFAIHERTGAEIAIPAGAEQEQVAADLGPAPAPELLAHLLNGSRFNFMILSSATNPQGLDRVILSPRAGGSMPMGTVQAQPVIDEDGEAVESNAVSPVRSITPGSSTDNPNPQAAPPDTKPSNSDVPD